LAGEPGSRFQIARLQSSFQLVGKLDGVRGRLWLRGDYARPER
jgi:hypothetical protein